MKKTLVLSIFLYLTLLLGSSCTDDGKLEGCDPPLPDVTPYSNKTGILTLSDSIPGQKLSSYQYYLYSTEIIPNAPLEICNSSSLSSLLDQNEIINVEFSGNIYNVPDNVYVLTIPFELTFIKKINIPKL